MADAVLSVRTSDDSMDFCDGKFALTDEGEIKRGTVSVLSEEAEEPEDNEKEIVVDEGGSSVVADEDQEEESDTSSAQHRFTNLTGKRERKKTQRLSETWSRDHEEKSKVRAELAKETAAQVEAGRGTELGDIPLIDATIRRMKPSELKTIHHIIYGRPGAVNEVRSNLRRFRGFGFHTGSSDYTKKLEWVKQRQLSQVRDSLRILHLEVSGQREQLASRLLDFLMKPEPSACKYKGKIMKKPGGRGRPKRTGNDKHRKTMSSHSQSTSNELSSDDQDVNQNNDALSSDDSSAPTKPIKKRGRPPSKKTDPKPKPKRSRRRVDAPNDSDSDEESLSEIGIPPKVDEPKVELSDEDVPLTKFSKKKHPTDDDLKRCIIELLNTVNLEETSLKVVREMIFAKYAGFDLSHRKEFISNTVKEYLSQS